MKPQTKAIAVIITVATLALSACAWVKSAQGQAAVNAVVATAKVAATAYITDVATTGSFKITPAQSQVIVKSTLQSAVAQLNTFPANTPVASAAPAVIVNSTNDPAAQTATATVLSILPVNTTTAQAAVVISQATGN